MQRFTIPATRFHGVTFGFDLRTVASLVFTD